MCMCVCVCVCVCVLVCVCACVCVCVCVCAHACACACVHAVCGGGGLVGGAWACLISASKLTWKSDDLYPFAHMYKYQWCMYHNQDHKITNHTYTTQHSILIILLLG